MTERKNADRKRGAIASFLRAYAASDAARFHMPGHKGRLPGHETDITEIPGADNLLAPEGMIAEAQQEAARAFGAGQSFFLTGGSTGGMIAMLLALPPGSTVALPRDCHKSALSGLALSGHDAIFLPPTIDPNDETSLPVSAADVERALIENPAIDALLITRPDYYGRCADIESIAALCRERGLVLLVDEAHGAHLRFSDRLPESAAPYADAWTNSAHKTLAAPNQAAYLHVGRHAKLDPARVAAMLRLVQTSSPSYPALAALDDAWRNASDAWTRHAERLEGWIAALPDRWRNAIPFRGIERDPTRLVFDVQRACGLTGYDAERLIHKSNIVLEMSDRRRIVAITTPLDPDAWYGRLRDALLSLPEQTGHAAAGLHPLPKPPQRAMRVRQAALAPSESVPLERATGRVAAQAFGLYPPGIALVTPGEIVDAETIAYIEDEMKCGANGFGLPPRCVQ